MSDTKGPQDYGWEERAVTSNRGASKARSEDQWWRGGDEGAGDLTNRRPGEILRPGWGYYRLYGAWEDDAERRGRSHPDEAVVDAALESLGDFATGQGPWCLFVGPIGPHDPYIVPRRYRDLYDLDKVELPPSYSDVLTDKPNIYRRMREQLWDQLSKEEACDAVRHYWAYCTYEDELLGRLLDELDRRGWSDNTLVLLVSDHGDYVGAHGLFLKGVPAFREAYHVPAVVRWPAGIPQVGREISALVSLADFFPTFVELATGRPVTESLSGASLVPFLQGGPPERWREALLTQFNGVELYYSQRSLITTRWKFVYNGFDFDELYSRVDDPYETNNLARHGGYDDVVRELLEQMWRSAEREEDWLVFNRYPTVAFAAQGPMGQDYSGER